MGNTFGRGKIVILFGLISLMLVASPSTVTTLNHVSQKDLSVSPLASTTMDFGLTANPTSLTMAAGTTQTSTITATSLNGFVGTVYLATVSYPLISSLGSTSLILSSGRTASTTLTVSAPSATLPENETIIVDASGGCSLFHVADISARVTGPDFVVSAETTQITIVPGMSGTSTIDLASKNGFAGSVTLTSDASPLTSHIVPLTVSLSSGGVVSSTLTVTAPLGTDPGDYTASITASSGGLRHDLFVSITVAGATFTMSAYPSSLTLAVGGATNSSTITVSRVGGFTGTVDLVNTTYPPDLTVTLAPLSILLPPTGTATLTVSAPLGTPKGDYYVDVTGSSGTLLTFVSILVTVKGPDFHISSDPSIMTVVAGNPLCTSIISVAPLYGFVGTVGLTTKADPSFTISILPTPVTPPGTSALTVSAPLGMNPGFYTIGVNGTSTSPPVTHTIPVSVIVIGPDFTLSANPSSLTVTAGGGPSASTISMSPQLGFLGTVVLTTKSSDPGITATPIPSSITGSIPSTLSVTAASGTVPGLPYVIEVNGTSGGLIRSIFILVTVIGPDFTVSSNVASISFSPGTVATATIAISPILGFAAPISLAVFSSSLNLNSSIAPTTVSTGSYTATLSVNSTKIGIYRVDVLANSGGLSHALAISVTVANPDFTISAGAVSPSAVLTGGWGSAAITVTPAGGFAGPVSLIASASTPAGLSCWDPIPDWPGTGTPTLSCRATTAGDYTVTVTGTAMIGVLQVHRATGSILFHVVGFTIGVSPTAVTVNANTAGTSTVTITPVNNFNGVVNLSTDNNACSPSTPTVTGSGTAILSCTFTSGGTKTVTVTGATGTLSETATLTFNVNAAPAPNFTVTATTPPSFASGSDGKSTVTVTAQNGFYSNVDLSYTVSPGSGLAVSLSPTSLVYGIGISTATFTSSAPGTYTVTITGKSGSLSNSATVTAIVTPASQPTAPVTTTILGLDPTIFYGLVGGIVAIVVVGSAVVFMRGKKPPGSR